MKNCLNITRLISQEQEQELHWRQKMFLRLHVLMCPKCRNYRKQMAFLSQSVRKL